MLNATEYQVSGTVRVFQLILEKDQELYIQIVVKDQGEGLTAEQIEAFNSPDNNILIPENTITKREK